MDANILESQRQYGNEQSVQIIEDLFKQKNKNKIKEIFCDLNWHEQHAKTNLDSTITPLT